MPPPVAGTRILLNPLPAAHFGAGAIDAVGGIVRGTGCQAAVIVTDQGLARTAVVTSVASMLAASGLAVTVFSDVHANPTTGDVAAGADMVAARAAAGGRPAVVAVGGGSSIDAAKGIAVAAVNPERGRDLDYRRTFAEPALPLVAVPTTAGTGTETNPFGVITDPANRRKFYVGSATALPVAAVPPGGSEAVSSGSRIAATGSAVALPT